MKDVKKNTAAKKPIDYKYIRENLSDLIKILRQADEDLAFDFLYLLLSQKECLDLANRLAIIKMLDQGIVQRTISKDLGVSLCKITRGSSELKRPNSAFKRGLAVLKESFKA